MLQCEFGRLRFLYSCIDRIPVYFPGFSSILRECLFKAAGSWGDVGPHVSHQNISAIGGFRIVELSAPILKRTNTGYAQAATLIVGISQAPLPRFWVVQPERQRLDMSRRTVGLRLAKAGATIPKFAHNRNAIEFHPCIGPGQGMEASFYVGFPIAKKNRNRVDRPGVSVLQSFAVRVPARDATERKPKRIKQVRRCLPVFIALSRSPSPKRLLMGGYLVGAERSHFDLNETHIY